MARPLKVRPTKIELVKLERRLDLSRRVKKILKDRLAILTTAFIETARRAIGARRTMEEALLEALRSARVADGYHGALMLEKELTASEGGLNVTCATRNIAGARIPALQARLPEHELPPYDLVMSSSVLDEAAEQARRAVPAILRQAELDRALEILGEEIQRTKRISNALEYKVVPSLEATIHALKMKFEERDREEKARLKHIKLLRGAHSSLSGQHDNPATPVTD